MTPESKAPEVMPTIPCPLADNSEIAASTDPEEGSALAAAILEALIDRAEAAQREAGERNAEWLATRGLIKQARREADEGNWQLAADLAGQALQQGNLAVEQAERESEAWRDRVVR